MSRVMAKVAAHNIIADIEARMNHDSASSESGHRHEELPYAQIRGLCDDKHGVIMLSDNIYAPRKYQIVVPEFGLFGPFYCLKNVICRTW